MARHALTGAGDPAGQVAGYLAALDGALPPGPRRPRREILEEVGDGLLAAAERHQACGATADSAVRAALREFGSPRLVARAFAGELAAARVRRLLGGLLLTGPLVGVWWLLLLAPRRWPPNPAALVAAIPVLPVVGATVAVAVVVLAATGRLAHRLPALGPRSAVRAGQVVAVACLAVDVTLLGRLAILATAPRGDSTAIMVAAAAAGLVRLYCVAVAAERIRRSASTLA